MTSDIQGLLFVLLLPAFALYMAGQRYKQAEADHVTIVKQGAAKVGLAWLMTAASFYVMSAFGQPVDEISGGLLLGIAFTCFSVVAFPLAMTYAPGAWPAKVITALGICLMLMPGACFVSWGSAASTGIFKSGKHHH